MRFYPTKIQSNFVCFFLFSLLLIFGCSKDSDLLLDSVISDSVSSAEEKEKDASQEIEAISEEENPAEENISEETQEPNLESRTTSFSPTNDAHFESGKGYNQNIIRLDEGNRTSYLMFDLSPVGTINGQITDITLQLTVDSDNGSGSIDVFKANSSNWSEENLSENNIPQVVAHIGTILKEYEVGVTEFVELKASELSPEVSTLILNHKNGNDLAFASKEHPSKIGPKLVVTYEVPEEADEIALPEEEPVEDNSPTNEQPIAVADATPSSGEAPLEVSFSGSNSSDDGGITSFSWDFKDGSTATTSNPTHTFTSTGVYEALLTVTDAEGLTTSDTVTITVNETPNEGPKSIISATPITGEAPLEVVFKGSNSTDDQSISSYSWSFGNGAQTNSADFTYIYEEPGTYNAELTVTDENGLSDKASVTITVAESTNVAPVARTSANITKGTAPLTVQFMGDTSSDDYGITEYSWDLKDGSTAATANPSHTFTDPGTYVVELTVTDENGLSGKASITITVSTNAAPVARTSANTTQGTAPLTVQFTGDASSDDNMVTGYSWDFKNGSTAATANPSHTFTDAGTYVVELTVNDKEGLTHKKSITITVNQPHPNQPPVAVVSANPTFGEAPLTVQFLGNSSTDDKAITSYSWNFKDGSTSASANPLKTFNQAGSYSVDLTVTDADGATNTQSVTINVTNPVNNAPPGFYVATNGNSSNNGQSPSSPWSLEHAFSQAKSGDIIYVKAGNYGNKNLILYNSGNSGSPIKFIGYTNSPGDLVSSQGSTFTYGESLNSNKMPLLIGNSPLAGLALDLNGSFAEIHNFQITNYQTGILSKGRYNILKNVIVTNNGEQNNNNSQTGKGFQILGDNTILEDCFNLNSNAEGINLKGANNCTVKNTKVYSDNHANPGGYYIAVTFGGTNNVIEDCLIYRSKTADLHRGHGYVMKDQATNNIVRRSKAYNTGIEVNFSGVSYNTFDDVQIYGSYSDDQNEFSSGIRVINGAHHNTFKNIYIKDSRYPFNFHDFNDGFVGPGGDRDLAQGGNYNQFIGIVTEGSNSVVFCNTIDTPLGQSTSTGNTWTNCTFSNVMSVPFFSTHQTSNFTFTNCTFKNISGTTLLQTQNGIGSWNASYQNCNFINVSFPKPN